MDRRGLRQQLRDVSRERLGAGEGRVWEVCSNVDGSEVLQRGASPAGSGRGMLPW